MENNRHIRPATEADISPVLRMYDHSRGLMRAAGNTTQWVGYPTINDIRADIALGVSYIIEADGSPIGTFAVVPGIEPTYARIDHGRWIDPSPYATIHRLAKMPGCNGIWSDAFHFASSRYAHLRADTHESNLSMLRRLAAEGFVRCGIVYMSDGSPRVAYERWRYDEVPSTLKHYVEQDILPQYSLFDAAHREEHARRVIARAMVMQPSPVVYTAAAMHDLGLSFGRAEHHLHSGRIVRADRRLRQWFTEAEVETIAQAVEDHRASATEPPRSRIGAIVAEADRDVEPLTIVRRTVQYGLSHYPTLDRDGHWQRTLQHLDEKYSAHGYLRLWLDDSPNAAPLAELRRLIADTDTLRSLFDQYFEEYTV